MNHRGEEFSAEINIFAFKVDYQYVFKILGNKSWKHLLRPSFLAMATTDEGLDCGASVAI